MSDDNARELCQLGDKLFSRKLQLDHLWQTLAEQMYPERATFTVSRVEGSEFAEELFTSLPAQNRRSLAEALGALTRRKDRPWFSIKIQGQEDAPQQVKDWLSWAQDRQRTILYTKKAQFQKTMQVADNDVVTFGNAVAMQSEDDERSGIQVFRPCHLRDTAWDHDSSSTVNVLHRKFKISLRNVAAKYGADALSSAQRTRMEKSPHEEIIFRHIVMPRADYDAYVKGGRRKRMPWASIYVNAEAMTVAREGGYEEFPYHVRRWFVDDQSPYGYSPAAMLGLVEARLLQSQERIILDAGERVVDPPMIAVRDAVLGQVSNYAGATTWVDRDYDERTGDAVRALDTRGNIPLGLDMKQDTRQILAACMYINKLTLPSEGDMTAFEVNERVDEYIRTIGPAVEPFETDNAALLDTHFSFLMRVGQFGPVESIPQELQGAETLYEFDGPVQMAFRRQKLQKAKELRQMVFEEMQVRPDVADLFDFDKIDRDAANYIGAEPGWVLEEDDVAASRQAKAEAAAQQQAMLQAQQAGEMFRGALETVPAMSNAVAQIPQIGKGLEQLGAMQ